MRFFRMFKKKIRRRLETRQSQTAEILNRAASDITYLQGQIGTINIVLKKHEDQLTDHERQLLEQGKGLENLEQKVDTLSRISPTFARAYDPPARQVDQVRNCVPAFGSPEQKFDIDCFSEQERRIIGIFFQNKGRRMSYSDVASIMGKSAHTVKNQMHQIRRKADLFEKMTGPKCQNLFRLKDDLRVEKYLNVGQPVARPVSINMSTQSIPSKESAD